MKSYSVFFLLFITILFSCSGPQKPVDRVDPMIGTSGHGHTFPGVSMPFGMVQLSPDTRIDDWDGCSGYHYSDSTIIAFSHTHLSGTGAADLGDIRLMPTVGEVMLDPGTPDAPEKGYRSAFSHKNEHALAGYYSVLLDDDNIKAELTASTRVGFHKYTFPRTEEANIIIDLKNSIVTEKVLSSGIEIINDHEIRGFRQSKGWANNQWIFFHAEFSKPFMQSGIAVNDSLKDGQKDAEGDNIKAYVRFKTERSEAVMVKVAISAVDYEGALNNLKTEIPGWDFNGVQFANREAWNKELSKIEIEGGTKSEQTAFYTALYHAMLPPNVYSDVDGRYRGFDMNIYSDTAHTQYTVFSLWDTFRALHPLHSIIDTKRTSDWVNSMLNIYDHGGLLPVWELGACETWCMIGYHSIPVIVDAYFKGIKDFDTLKALNACVNSAMQNHHGLESLRKHGYIRYEDDGESVSKTLEYAYDDWCIAQFAKAMGNDSLYREFTIRAQYYKNLLDPTTGFMRARSNGGWYSPFDPFEVNFNYTEANSWQYSFFAPQDISGWMKLLGGKDAVDARLDSLFTAQPKTTGRVQPDISGLIGQYVHGNEPSHHIAYLYNYTGKPWKTQAMARRIMKEMYTDQVDGLCGNEDCGQMSAWYVLSAMGFYPVTPGSNIYALGSPLFKKITIHLENGKEFIIEAKNNSGSNIYIQNATLNGNPWSKSFLNHDDMAQGGNLILEMGNKPNENWGSAEGDIPVSQISDFILTPSPFVTEPKMTFAGEKNVAISCLHPDVKISYALGKSVTPSAIYQGAFMINKNEAIIYQASAENHVPSMPVYSEFIRIPEDRSIKLLTRFEPQYAAGGEDALIDYLRGGDNFRTGRWQGYHGKNIEAIVDLGKITLVKEVGIGCLQNQPTWIFMPSVIEIYASDNGTDFKQVATVNNDVPQKQEGAIIKDFMAKNLKLNTRYIKVVARNIGKIPEWHLSAGNDAWVFADEIIIR